MPPKFANRIAAVLAIALFLVFNSFGQDKDVKTQTTRYPI